MSTGDRERMAAGAGRRKLRLLLAAVIFLALAWFAAYYPPIRQAPTLLETSTSQSLFTAGAVPWFLQWAGIICAMLYFCRSPRMRTAASIAVTFSLAFAALWWGGLILRFRGMDPLDAITELIMFKWASSLGAFSWQDEFLFNFLGPIVGPVQLRGPINLQGWNFPLVMSSTILLVGYLLLVGRVCQVGGKLSVRSYIKFSFLVLPCFLPPFIRLAMRMQDYMP